LGTGHVKKTGGGGRYGGHEGKSARRKKTIPDEIRINDSPSGRSGVRSLTF